MCKKVTAKQLFYLVNSIGQSLDGDIHIIDTTTPCPEHEDCKSYRVYHSAGYCFDVEKNVEDWSDTNPEQPSKWDYVFYAQFDGFYNDGFTVEKAYKLLQK